LDLIFVVGLEEEAFETGRGHAGYSGLGVDSRSGMLHGALLDVGPEDLNLRSADPLTQFLKHYYRDGVDLLSG
jgi:hypothetical protein